MHSNKLFWTRTDVGALIHYALNRRVERDKGVMN